MRPSETPTILVVEDEVLIREDAIDVLEHEGFEALRAGSAGEAMAILDRRSDVQAVFTDIQMPGDRDGIDLARYLARWRPSLPVLVTSGRSFAAPADLPASSRFVPKPYMPRRVATILREMITDARGPWPGGADPPGGIRGSPATT